MAQDTIYNSQLACETEHPLRSRLSGGLPSSSASLRASRKGLADSFLDLVSQQIDLYSADVTIANHSTVEKKEG